MRFAHRPLASAGLAALLLAALPFGCGGQKPVDPDQARATLAMALDAWHDGRTIDEVTNGSPPITVADPCVEGRIQAVPLPGRRDDPGRGFRPEDAGRTLARRPQGQGCPGEGQVHRQRPAGADRDPRPVLTGDRSEPSGDPGALTIPCGAGRHPRRFFT